MNGRCRPLYVRGGQAWSLCARCGAEFHPDCLYDYSHDHGLPGGNMITNRSLFASWDRVEWPHLEHTAPFYTSSMGALVKVGARAE